MSIESIRNSAQARRWRTWAGGLCMALALVLVVLGRAAATDVTACHQTVVARDTGVLQADLTCSDSATAVFLDDRATLDLGGHTITGGGIFCLGRRCSIIGPGTVQQVVGIGNSAAIYAGSPGGRLSVQDLTLTDNAFGIVSNAFKNTFTNVTASNNQHIGILAFGNTNGSNVITNDNGETGFASELKGIHLIGLTATGNGQAGLINNGHSTHLTDSTLTGNAFGPFPGDPTMLDIFTVQRPHLVNTTCEHSLGPRNIPWGVCSGD